MVGTEEGMDGTEEGMASTEEDMDSEEADMCCILVLYLNWDLETRGRMKA